MQGVDYSRYSQGPICIPLAKSICLNVIFHIKCVRNIIPWLNAQTTSKLLGSIMDTQEMFVELIKGYTDAFFFCSVDAFLDR